MLDFYVIDIVNNGHAGVLFKGPAKVGLGYEELFCQLVQIINVLIILGNVG